MIVEHLKKEKNVLIRAMSRKAKQNNNNNNNNENNIEWCVADLMDPISLDKALENVDVVISSANGYMKESINTDFQGNKNLVDAASRCKSLQRFVFLSIVGCDKATDVPHFHAKRLTEEALANAKNINFVSIRAPAFFDQQEDYLADGVGKGSYYAIGDRSTTKWSYILTDDLALYLAKAAVYPNDEINKKIIDVGWKTTAICNDDVINEIQEITKTQLSVTTIPWFVLSLLYYPVWLFSSFGYDMVAMFFFFKTGSYIANIEDQEKYFGPAPTMKEAITRWANNANLIKK